MNIMVSKDIKEKSKLTKEEWREYTKTVWSIANVTSQEHPAVFPEEIPMRLIKLFTFLGEKVLDPFAGIGTTGIVALKNGRDAICIDQNPDYTEIIKKNTKKLEVNPRLTRFENEGYDCPEIDIKQGDSRKLLKEIGEDSIDLIVTSPPYWNKADYGDRPENLGNIEGYTDFLEEIRPAFEECYRVLRPERKICIVTANVNQYTEQGLLTFPLPADFTKLLWDIGFVMVSDVVWSKDKTGGKWGSWGTQRPIFGSYPYPPNFLFKNVHEHILIFAKRTDRHRKGEKVRKLENIL